MARVPLGVAKPGAMFWWKLMAHIPSLSYEGSPVGDRGGITMKYRKPHVIDFARMQSGNEPTEKYCQKYALVRFWEYKCTMKKSNFVVVIDVIWSNAAYNNIRTEKGNCMRKRGGRRYEVKGTRDQ